MIAPNAIRAESFAESGAPREPAPQLHTWNPGTPVAFCGMPKVFPGCRLLFAILTAVPGLAGTVCWHHGTCDASAVVLISDNLFLAASDEENRVRLYRARVDGLPVEAFPLYLSNRGSKGPETDIEGAARVGDRVYWIGSHARNKDGALRLQRRQFLATDLATAGDVVTVQVVGRSYRRLIEDLTSDPRLVSFRFDEGSRRAPKESGALNIEGLAERQEGGVWLGFRNPVPEGKALLIPLLNPNELVEVGLRARFGEPVLVDLGGRSVRDMVRAGDQYFIVGGFYDGHGRSFVYRWNGRDSVAEKMDEQPLKGLNPEAIAVWARPSGYELLLTSDDGNRDLNGDDCKDIKDMNARRFRSYSYFP
jgi:hypothetical protein